MEGCMRSILIMMLVPILFIVPASQLRAAQTLRVTVSEGEMTFDPRTIPSEIQPHYMLFKKFCLDCHGEGRVILTLRTRRSPVTGERYGEEEFRQKIVRILRGSKNDLDREAAKELITFFSYLINRATIR